MTKKPPGWDQDKWENELNRNFNTIRKKAFDKLYKSCKRKRDRHLQEEEIEHIRKEEEARHAEERRKAERQRRAEELEKEADQLLQDEFEFSWKELGIDISEDEEDGEVIPEENKERRDDEKSLENGKNGTKEIKSETCDEAAHEPEVNRNGDDYADYAEAPAVSLGGNADEDSASSTLSCGASGQTPKRKSMRLQTKNIALKLNQRSQMSTASVQILSNPSLVSALEVFQGTRFGTQDDMELLKNQRVLQALREFHVTLDSDVTPPPVHPTCASAPSSLPSVPSSLPSVPSTLPSAPTEEEFDEKVVENIKQERPKCAAKHKLTDYESFAGVLKSIPKRKKSSKESSVEQTYGSPNRGIISTRDSTKPGMKAMAKGKVEHMREGDVILKKSDVSSKKQNMAVFSQVSFMHFFSWQKRTRF